MENAENYKQLIAREIRKNPKKTCDILKLGLNEKRKYLSELEGKIPEAYRKIGFLGINSLERALNNPENTVLTNLFTPVELVHAFDMNTLSIEIISTLMPALQSEDFFSDAAGDLGISETLCSYHRTFIGTQATNAMPKFNFALTTSSYCDGNVQSIRFAAKKNNIDSFVIDVPYEYTPINEKYVVSQLKKLISLLEEKSNKKFDEEKLKEILKRENETKRYYKEYLKQKRTKYYPSNLDLDNRRLMVTHIEIGSEEACECAKMLAEEIKGYPDMKGFKIFWIHLFPNTPNSLTKYFEFNPKYQVQGFLTELDYMDEMDIEHPLEALARKMMMNCQNGSFTMAIDKIEKYVDELDCDAVIQFCHLGCKQSYGNVMQIKEAMKKKHIPMLILDGDCVDRRNCNDGQLKTRVEAFLEMLENQKGGR